MRIRRLVTGNLGYALLGGPVLGIISVLVGTYLFGTVPGIGCAVVVYGLGWALAVRRSERRTQKPMPDSDDDRTRKELEAEKGSFGGNGGGGG
ncbi:hypothetical protein [Halorussus caseinilyticus]|uniref:hypothetical protein n=1 Tax=Halorussus caseinilyticus TaxID=3034025 RepID=UPI0023E87E4B|nr:hypothetical protein [Halorussus sp. DT72]